MAAAPEVILADFETLPIGPRPNYPPKPVSLALKWPGQREYKLMAWGHEGGDNNCTEKEARGEYKRARDSKFGMCFQNGKFDQDVAETHWEIPLLPWERFHDTMFLLFYFDPHAPSLGLKASAERILGIKPEEQDRMMEWILANVPEAKKRPSTAGQYIYKCPYRVVKPYHKGDLTRTGGLFDFLYPKIVATGMLPAYERDRKLMPILLENERIGMQIDVDRLAKDLPVMRKGVELADKFLRKRLGIDNVDSDRQLGRALHEKGLISEVQYTKYGQVSTSKKFLTIDKFKDKRVYQALQYRGQMSTSISMFGEPWLELASQSRDGRTLHPNLVQVRSSKTSNDDKLGGARSGRLISVKPNFYNIPKKWKRAITAGYVHPAFLGNIPQLPYMRSYCLPDKGEQWGKRDFNQQELRLFGHFEEGPVQQGFLSGADFDIHEDVRAEAEARLIAAVLRDSFDRDTAKTCVFGRVYGQGLRGLMLALKLAESQKQVAQIIQKAINTAVPSINELDRQLKDLAKQGLPIRTWGGRLYYCEDPKYSEEYGRDMTFEYKLLNYLLQGSGADVTKETIIRWYAHPKRRGRLVVTVYDEVDFSSPPKAMKQDQTSLRDSMRSIETDVPMLSDGESGPNWGTLEKYPV
jgi:DNA polymerase I-like protein with 3'-5' exonuclease and polymerase domains